MDLPNVVVIGGSGFIGSHLVAKLSASGARVTVPTRRYESAKHLILLPRVEVLEASVHDDVVLRQIFRNAGAVVNLVGLLHSRPGQPYGPDFAQAHVELPRRIAAMCAAQGVPRYLHMSALGAAAGGPSMYQRSKAAGEQAASSQAAVAATIFRPSVVFGAEDRFINLFAAMQKFMPVVPLACAHARFQPVYVEDVAQAFVNALNQPASRGRTYELGGPAVYTLEQIVRLAGAWSGHPRPVLPLPEALGRVQAWVLEHLPGTPLMSRDNLDSMKRDNVIDSASNALTAAALGIKLTALEAMALHYAGRAAPRFDDFRHRAGR